MRLLLDISITLLEPRQVAGEGLRVVLLPFLAEANGPLFWGKTLQEGVDTQFHYADGRVHLSARYLLEGRDGEQNACRLFIQNEGTDPLCCRPVICTDSRELAFLQELPLLARVQQGTKGLCVQIFAEE
ncbi:MAG: hypothetical protein IJR17_00250 [Clostridia bacterium]|nr:hypothetical protein [Clostridia bacterium]